jgi:hypothetical protein
VDDTGANVDCPGAFDRDMLPDGDELRTRLDALALLVPQRPGDDHYEAWVASLETSLTALPDVVVERVPLALVEQRVDTVQLSSTLDGETSVVDVAAVVSGSGLTGSAGVQGRARFLATEDAVPVDLAGLVIVTPLVIESVPVDVLLDSVTLVQDERGTLATQSDFQPGADFGRPWMTTEIGARLQAMEAAGAAGVLLLSGFADDEAADLWVQTPQLGLPAVVLADETARLVRDAVRSGVAFDVDLVIEGEREERSVTTLRARLPGATDEVVVLTAASDAQNLVDGAGAIGLVALAEAFSAWPTGCRERALLLDFSPGWRSDGAGVAALVADLEPGRVAFAAGLDQPGAVEFLPEGAVAESLIRTGLPELRVVSASRDGGLADLAAEQVTERELDRTWVVSDGPSWGHAGGLASAPVPTLHLFSGPWTLTRATVAGDAVDTTSLRSAVAWLGHVVDASGSLELSEL